MNESRAREILKGTIGRESDGSSVELYDLTGYIFWSPDNADRIVLDGEFTRAEITAIAWWVNHNTPTEGK